MHVSLRQLLFLFLLLICTTSFGQYAPKNEAVLNFNAVCFEFPWVKDADFYELVIYEDEPWKSETYTSVANKIIIDELSFGSVYYWKILAKKNNKQLSESELMHFEITKPSSKDDLRFVRFNQKMSLCSNELFIYDYAGVMMNRKNEINWFMPSRLQGMPPMKGIRDLKMTEDGTFLAIIDSMAFEFDPMGKILWQAPNSGEISHMKTEDYHHDFQKLPNGNYMILGTERIRKQFKGEKDSTTFDSGTIIEYSPKGNVVWYWRAKDFFTDELLAQRRKEDGKVNAATHMNSFHVDGNNIYVGFRDASWILKIDKPSKKVVELYGGHDSGLPNHFGKELFLFQHDTQLLKDGNSMAVVNNDSIKSADVVSSLVVFSLGDDTHDKGDLLFRFPFNFDKHSDGKSMKLGNVTELSNGNYLINMGALNRVVEIQPDGNVVWDCFTEKYDSLKHVWRPYQQYRVATTSSLYPNEFTAKWEESGRTATALKGKLIIFNVGSDNHSYSISAKHKNGTIRTYKTDMVVNAKGKQELELNVEQTSSNPVTSIEVRVGQSTKMMKIDVKGK